MVGAVPLAGAWAGGAAAAVVDMRNMRSAGRSDISIDAEAGTMKDQMWEAHWGGGNVGSR